MGLWIMRSRVIRKIAVVVVIQLFLIVLLLDINWNTELKDGAGAIKDGAWNNVPPPKSPRNVTILELKMFMDEYHPLTRTLGTTGNNALVTSHSHVWVGEKWAELTTTSRVCLATHSTVEWLFWVALQGWDGPASVSVFTPGTDYAVTVAMIYYLRQCFPRVKRCVNFHIMYPKDRPPRIPDRWTIARDLNCSDPEDANNLLLDLRNETKLTVYPQNHNRNLAKKNCPTDYSITIDTDMLTPPFMAQKMTAFLDSIDKNKPCMKCVFVLPIYEVKSTANYRPQNKTELLRLLKTRQAQRYHIKVYSPNQANSRLWLWENETLAKGGDDGGAERSARENKYQILYNITNYGYTWEPIVVMPYTAPLFDERFLGYGFVRNSQIYELYQRGYTFHVLDKAFLTHRGFQTRANYTPLRNKQILKNSLLYNAFKEELKLRMKYEKRIH